MENRITLGKKLSLGGALFGAFLLPFLALGYSQHTTHPALTDEIVDFYNVSFPADKLTYEEKQWLIKGSIDEDDDLRFFSHFYDPVHNKGHQSIYTAGLVAFSSKEWALGETQKKFYNGQMTGLAAISNADSPHDFSYDRALQDYARGNKQRAFIAFGHVLHLLEDAGVPDHTRNDPHPPHLETSPYEKVMHKWNPENFQIARTLFLIGEKPALLSTMESYFDKIAHYSNGYFYSKDTIDKDYENPKILKLANSGLKNTQGGSILYGLNQDRDARYFELVFAQVKITPYLGTPEISNKSLTVVVNDELKTTVLDAYWERLSKEVVVSGAGALRLFLEEAEKARKEYLAKAEQKKLSFWAQIAGLFGFGGSDDDKLATSEGLGTSDVNDDRLTTSDVGATSDVHNLPVVSGDGDSTGDSGDTNGDRNVSPSLSPILSPSPTVSPHPTPTPTPVDNLKQNDSKININTASKAELETLKGIGPSKAQGIIDHRAVNGQFQRIEDIMKVSGIGQATFDGIKDQITVGDIVPTPSPTPTPVVYGGGGGGGGGGSSPTPTPEPEGDTANAGDVLINEIAWMGTDVENGHLCEWVELRNTISGEINLAGWTLFEQDGSVEIISLTQKISPNGYYLIERVTDSCPDAVPSVEADDSGSFGGSGLNNTDGEKLTLKDIAGTTINEVDGSNGWKINGDDEIIGDNVTKKTAQRMTGSWITAIATPKAINAADSTAQAPSAVTDLAAAHGSPTITATWTAPDPGAYGPTSLSYDLRYSLTNLTASGSWDTATKVASSSLPAIAEQGASQSVTFDIAYEYGQTYYLALRTKLSTLPTCDVGNSGCSGVSNVATVSFAGALDDDAWTMAGKDQYHTSYAATVAGPGATATISWTFDAETLVSGYVVSQPVADADGNIYFGAANGSSGKIVKLDKNGLKQWDYATNVNIGTPAVLSDGTVYFGRVGAGGAQQILTALNPDGTKKWDYSDNGKVESLVADLKGKPHFVTTGTTPKKLIVLNSDGTEKLAKSTNDVKGNPVVLGDGSIITPGKAGGGSHLVTKYDENGTQLWQVSTLESMGNTLADPSHDTATGITYSAAGSRLFVIPQDGSTVDDDNIIAPSGYAAATTVAITDDTLYVGFNNTNPASGSLLYALNKSDLLEKWAEPFEADGQLNNQLVVDSGGNTYFSTTNGKLYGVDSNGSQLWPPVETGSNSTISPVLTEHGLVWGWGSKIAVIK